MLFDFLVRIGQHPILMLAVGGALGTLARYGISEAFAWLGWSRVFPWATFAINVLGSFILTLAALFILEYGKDHPEWKPWFLLIGTGFCGGFTTFSTYEWEIFKLVRSEQLVLAAAYAVGSVVTGFAGVLLAVLLMTAVLPRA